MSHAKSNIFHHQKSEKTSAKKRKKIAQKRENLFFLALPKQTLYISQKNEICFYSIVSIDFSSKNDNLLSAPSAKKGAKKDRRNRRSFLRFGGSF